MSNIKPNDWNTSDNLVHPKYNDGYDRYDLSVNEIIKGLKDAGYDLDDNGEGNWWEDDNLSELINYRLEVSSNKVPVLDSIEHDVLLSAKLYVNNKDVTNTVTSNCFKWTRVSGNSEVNKLEDAEWNLRFSEGSKEILVTHQDVNRRALFECKFVKYNDDVEWVKNAYATYTNLINK